MQISDVSFVAAPPQERETGLLGWLSCVLNDALEIDGIALRRTLDGTLTISFPARKDRRGRQHPLIRPLNDGVRLDLERQVLEALALKEAAP